MNTNTPPWNTNTPPCPHCGSTDIQYYEVGSCCHDVLGINNGTIQIGKVQAEDITESGFNCQQCHKDIAEFDELDKDFG